jgi:hypothetical protein
MCNFRTLFKVYRIAIWFAYYLIRKATIMAISRRGFLKGVGVTFIAVAGGTVYRSVDQGVFEIGQGPAYETWHTWRSDASTPQERIVKAGILASNPHNSQPWLFRIEEDRISLPYTI